MPSSPLKRPSTGGRLRRLLASLRPPPARAGGPLPVQTGFPTSLADLVVKNHGRFHNPRRRHRAGPPPSPAPAEPVPQPRLEELSVTQDQEEDDAAAPAPAPPSPKAAAFISVRRPELLAVGGGAVALALLLVWSKLVVAAATFGSVALLWIESASRSRASPRRPRPETRDELGGPGGRVSAIPDAEESPRPPSCADSEPGRGSEAADGGASVTPERKEKRRRSLRRLLAKKLRSPSRDDKDSRHGGEHPVVSEVNAGPVRPEPTADAEETTPPPFVAVSDDGRWNCRRVGTLPPAAVAPIVLVGLVAGKLPAVALTVLCAAMFSSGSISRERPRPSATR